MKITSIIMEINDVEDFWLHFFYYKINCQIAHENAHQIATPFSWFNIYFYVKLNSTNLQYVTPDRFAVF